MADIWEFNGKTFKRCPKCNKGIPAEWKSHSKCGWGKEEQPATEQTEAVKIEVASEIVYGCIKEGISVLEQIKKESNEVFYSLDHILNVADQIRRQKLADLIRKK